jgi:sucrose-6-phosphate hydrolase SacC (GH32 family)
MKHFLLLSLFILNGAPGFGAQTDLKPGENQDIRAAGNFSVLVDFEVSGEFKYPGDPQNLLTIYKNKPPVPVFELLAVPVFVPGKTLVGVREDSLRWHMPKALKPGRHKVLFTKNKNECRLFINGELSKAWNSPKLNQIFSELAKGGELLSIRMGSDSGAFSKNFAGGTIHAARFYDEGLDDQAVCGIFGLAKTPVYHEPAKLPMIGTDRSIFEKPETMDYVAAISEMQRRAMGKMVNEDKYFPQYHLSLPTETHDPTLFFHEGVWHLFPNTYYNHNLNSAAAAFFRGHLYSEDLITWKLAPAAAALWNFSNGGVIGDGKGKAYYFIGFDKFTGGDVLPTPLSLASAEDKFLTHWTKLDSSKIVFPQPPNGIVRDMFLMNYLDGYLAIAPEIDTKDRRLFAYFTKDLVNFEYQGIFYEGDFKQNRNHLEVPFLQKIGDLYVFGACQRIDDKAAYLLGDIRDFKFIKKAQSNVADYGPAKTVLRDQDDLDSTLYFRGDDQGRVLFSRLIRNTRESGVKFGWYAYYPIRDVRLLDGPRMGFFPLRELESLRTNKVSVTGLKLPAGKVVALEGVTGFQREILLSFDNFSAQKVLTFSQGGQELILSIENNELVLDTTRVDWQPSMSGEKPGRFTMPLPDRTGGTLRIFLDHSLFEVFTDEGNVATATLLFPDPKQVVASIRSAEDGEISFDTWQMKSIWSEYLTEGQEPGVRMPDPNSKQESATPKPTEHASE